MVRNFFRNDKKKSTRRRPFIDNFKKSLDNVKIYGLKKFLEKFYEDFSSYDKNQDGFIEKEEKTEMLKRKFFLSNPSIFSRDKEYFIDRFPMLDMLNPNQKSISKEAIEELLDKLEILIEKE